MCKKGEEMGKTGTLNRMVLRAIFTYFIIKYFITQYTRIKDQAKTIEELKTIKHTEAAEQ